MAGRSAKRSREGSAVSAELRPRNSKRLRSGTREPETDRSFATRSGLLCLPIEILYDIHVLAKNPSFPLINRDIHSIFHVCPTGVKARYLIARWHEAYCYGFSNTLPHTTIKRQQVPNRPPLPSADLIDNGALVELSWNSRFLPVLPSSGLPYPLSNSAHRSADHFVLDYCLRFRVTDLEVLHACEDIVLRSPEFGNIVTATGLWVDAEGLVHTHEPKRHDAQQDGMTTTYVKPKHLRVTELPKRLFQMRKREDAAGEKLTLENLQGLDGILLGYMRAFGRGKGSCPSLRDLMVILAVVALHLPSTTAGMPAAAAPFNSFEGLPLAKATVVKSPFMVQLLLAMGAEPSRKSSIALYIAIRTGWLEGLQQLVERSTSELTEWRSGIERIRRWFMKQEAQGDRDWRKRMSLIERADSTQSISSELDVDSSKDSQSAEQSRSDASIIGEDTARLANKRRRLLDRANLDSKMLKEAVKYDHWHVANWIRSKGVIPDLRTIKLIEMKQQFLEGQPK